jgi:hypothetical protein
MKNNSKKNITLSSSRKVDNLFIDVFIGSESHRIFCDSGKQTFKWLQDIAINLHDNQYAFHKGYNFLNRNSLNHSISTEYNYTLDSNHK